MALNRRLKGSKVTNVCFSTQSFGISKISCSFAVADRYAEARSRAMREGRQT